MQLNYNHIYVSQSLTVLFHKIYVTLVRPTSLTYTLWFARLAYYVMICIQFYSNGGFHASDSVPGPWITFLYPVRVTLRYYFTFYMTMNVVQLPNKVTSFMISIIHSFIHWLQPSHGDS